MKNQIEKVYFLDNFQLDILLSDGTRLIYDMRPKLETARFCDLADKQLFLGGKVINAQQVSWDNGAEIFLDEILMDYHGL